jgi:hypothetical protein
MLCPEILLTPPPLGHDFGHTILAGQNKLTPPPPQAVIPKFCPWGGGGVLIILTCSELKAKLNYEWQLGHGDRVKGFMTHVWLYSCLISVSSCAPTVCLEISIYKIPSFCDHTWNLLLAELFSNRAWNNIPKFPYHSDWQSWFSLLLLIENRVFFVDRKRFLPISDRLIFQALQ